MLTAGAYDTHLTVGHTEGTIGPGNPIAGRVVDQSRVGDDTLSLPSVDRIDATHDLGISFVPVHGDAGENDPVRWLCGCTVLDIEDGFAPLQSRRHQGGDQRSKSRFDLLVISDRRESVTTLRIESLPEVVQKRRSFAGHQRIEGPAARRIPSVAVPDAKTVCRGSLRRGGDLFERDVRVNLCDQQRKPGG